jgi:Tfp pilus assembly protein PilX
MKPISHPRYQSGISLLVALVALVIMSLAGIALMRLVDTNALISSNAAFRQSARESTDASVEAARNWIMTKTPGVLQNDDTENGYYASYASPIFDFTGNQPSTPPKTRIKWKNSDGSETDGTTASACLNLGIPDASGVTTCYVIQRMCDVTGTADKLKCDQFLVNGGAGLDNRISPSRQDMILGPRFGGSSGGNVLSAGAVIYRITVRASGVRGNVSYVQALITG